MTRVASFERRQPHECLMLLSPRANGPLRFTYALNFLYIPHYIYTSTRWYMDTEPGYSHHYTTEINGKCDVQLFVVDKYLSMDFSVSHLDFTYICCCSWFSSPVMSRVKHHCKLSPVPASCGAPIWPGPDLDQDFQLSSCHTETNNGSTLTPTNICHRDPVRRSVRISIIYLLMSPKWLDYLPTRFFYSV